MLTPVQEKIRLILLKNIDVTSIIMTQSINMLLQSPDADVPADFAQLLRSIIILFQNPRILADLLKDPHSPFTANLITNIESGAKIGIALTLGEAAAKVIFDKAFSEATLDKVLSLEELTEESLEAIFNDIYSEDEMISLENLFETLFRETEPTESKTEKFYGRASHLSSDEPGATKGFQLLFFSNQSVYTRRGLEAMTTEKAKNAAPVDVRDFDFRPRI